MVGRYKAYAEYKDSGVDWLHDIPTHWKTIPVGRCYRRVKRTGFENEELLSVYRDHGVVPKSSRDDNNNKPSDDLSPYQLVCENNLVMNKMKAWQGSIAISEFRGIVSPAYFVYEPMSHIDSLAYPKYVHYLLRHPIYITQYMSRSKGIRVNQWDLDPEEFQRIELLLPQREEQKAIISFLDHEIAKIDTLITKQEKLIELLKEKRQAVISHAVTKGLNPQTPMKDSGVEWLGEVPEHWLTSKVKNHCLVKGRIGFRGYTVDDLVGEGEGALVVGATEMSLSGDIELQNPQFISWDKYFESPEIMLEKDMVLIVQRGSTVGKVAIVSGDLGEATINPSLIVLKESNLHPQYLKYSLMSTSIQRLIAMERSSTAIPMISQEQVSNYWILVPPEHEQFEICHYLGSELTKVDQVLRHSNQSIDLMKERKTALISAAVTGKIDVRDWKAEEVQG